MSGEPPSPLEDEARKYLGPRTAGISESTYLRSVLALIVNRERLDKQIAKAQREAL